MRFAQQIANTNTREEIAANQDLIVWLARMFGQQTATRVLPYIDRLKEEQAERERASVFGTDMETGEEVSVTNGSGSRPGLFWCHWYRENNVLATSFYRTSAG